MGSGWIFLGLGLLVAFLSVVLIGVHFGCGPDAGTPACFDVASDWLYRWQTLIAGAMAIVGAAATVLAIRHQVSASIAQSKRAREAAQLAALFEACKTTSRRAYVLARDLDVTTTIGRSPDRLQWLRSARDKGIVVADVALAANQTRLLARVFLYYEKFSNKIIEMLIGFRSPQDLDAAIEDFRICNTLVIDVCDFIMRAITDDYAYLEIIDAIDNEDWKY